MSKWEIFSGADRSLRWERSGSIFYSKPEVDPEISPNGPLPSMADLLVQGRKKFLEDGERRDSKMIFRTGLGKSVAIKEPSISKESSILGQDQDFNSDLVPPNSGDGYSGSLFQTGSGKKVNVSAAGIARAGALLGLEQDNAPCHQKGFQIPRKYQTPIDKSGWQDSSGFEKYPVQNFDTSVSVSTPRQPLICKSVSGGSKMLGGNFSLPMNSKIFESAQEPQFKFRTAGGRSLSVSTGALKRARSFLGDHDIGSFLDEVGTYDSPSNISEEIRNDGTSSSKESDFSTFSHQGIINNRDKGFISPLKSYSNKIKSCTLGGNTLGTNLIEKFEEAGNARSTVPMFNTPTSQTMFGNKIWELNPMSTSSIETGAGSRINPAESSSGRALTDISNIVHLTDVDSEQIMNKKRILGRTNFAAPFKRPRSSNFSSPFKDDAPHARNGTSTLSSERSCGTRRISTRYPFRFPRVSLKQYFGLVPSTCNMKYLSDRGKQTKTVNADKYLFSNESDYNCIGKEVYRNMLAKSGASMQYISEGWIRNHYKWIVWKLASYERHHRAYFPGKFLTTANVLEELKYRYEREVNYGHRSAIKRILEGDASPSMMTVLCISAISSDCRPNIEINNATGNGGESTTNFKVEVTDGWYSMEATLDVLLSKQLSAGKLFVGQKIRIWGAGLCGWVGSISPLEMSGTVSLLLNINGTYRAHWADRLGFCKSVGAPLAFRCIKSDGGQIPRTLAGLTRIYPVLYKERLTDGGSVVRSEKMEIKAEELHNQMCLAVREGIVAQYEMGINFPSLTDLDDSEEAKIYQILETAEEPDILMADMSYDQLVSLSNFRAKLEARRQSEMEKCIETALANAGLRKRDVTPFMKVRVVGLRNRNCNREERTKEGIITIWNPTEKQKHELVEGNAYTITGLTPSQYGAGTLHLQARGSMTKWHPLSPSAAENFQPFFTPRKSISLSDLGEIPISSKFDVAGFVVHVGEAYSDDPISCSKKQWVFVTDYSASDLRPETLSKSLLAICFCSYIQDDSFEPISSNLVGSTVGFCNLVNKEKDWKHHVWVAEATCISSYSLKFDHRNSHLKNAATSVQMWAKVSTPIINKLWEKVRFIIRQSKG